MIEARVNRTYEIGTVRGSCPAWPSDVDLGLFVSIGYCVNEASVHVRLGDIGVSKHPFQTDRTNDLANPSLPPPNVVMSVPAGTLNHLAQPVIALLPSAFHSFDHFFRSGGGVSRSGTVSRTGTREGFLGSGGGAPSPRELDSSHERA